MTFEQLQYFIEVYRQKSITKAAENLYVSRPVVSNMIKKLEHEFNLTFFQRSSNKIEPTEAGELFYESALEIISAQSILNQKMLTYSAQNSNTEKKIISIAIGDTLANIYGDEIFDVLSDAFPSYQFHFTAVGFSSQNFPYENFDLSIAVLSETLYPSSNLNPLYAVYSIKEIPSYIWISAKSPLCQQYDVLTYNLLEDHTHLIFKEIFNPFTTLDSGKKIQTVKFKQQFIDMIENSLCFTSDLPINHGRLLFKNLFEHKNIILKPTNTSSPLKIIYKKDLCSQFLSAIIPIFSDKLDSIN